MPSILEEAGSLGGKGRLRSSSPQPLLKGASAIESNPSAIIVYIHGIGAQVDATTLKRQYDSALFQQDMGDRSRLAYWADFLHPMAAPNSSVAVRNLFGSKLPADETLQPTVPEEQVWPAEIRQRIKDLPTAEAWSERLSSKLATAEVSADPLPQSESKSAKVLPEGPARRWLTRQLTRLFLDDVYQYFFQSELRSKMQDRLRHVLIPGGGPYFLISHSLGTLIAYDVMQEMSRAGSATLDVPLWITLGSPLGIGEVQDMLERDASGQLSCPRVVTNWENFADVWDPVALVKEVEPYFRKSSSQSIVDAIGFWNLDSRRIQDFNPHSALGYIGHPEVRKKVQSRLSSNFATPTSDFVVARDVANRMSGHSNRMPVLIEMKNASHDSTTLEDRKKDVVEHLKQLVGSEFLDARIDPLQRFVAANLTPEEINQLRVVVDNLTIHRIWNNSVKRATMHVSAQRVQAYTARIGYSARGTGIGWAVVDTGIRKDHPHFNYKGDSFNPPMQNVVAQWNCTLGLELDPVKNPSTTDASDDNGHGTHVAGIIAGRGNGTAEGVQRELFGMAEQANLHIYKVLDKDGQGSDSYIIKALDHICEVNEKAGRLVIHGVNLSLGGPFDASVYGCGQSPICRELRRLWQSGVLVCIAAGNEGTLKVNSSDGNVVDLNLDLSIGDPANLEEAIAVGSVNRDFPHLNGISYFSSRGPTADGRAKPDVVAPGEWIWSCNAKYDQNLQGQEPYIPDTGTSMACPHVSGLLAAFLSVRMEFAGRPDEVKRLLLDHATDLKRDRYHQGAGLPNLVKMLAGT